MTAALYTWIAMPGVIVAAGTLFDVSLRAATTVDDTREGGIRHVVYTVHVNGVPWNSGLIRSEAVRRPNFSNQPSRMPGAQVGTMAPFPGWGFTLDADACPSGQVEVDAVVHSNAGTTTALPTLSFYNRVTPPCTKVIHLDFGVGNDANDGTSWAQAVRTARRAQILVRVNPAGSTLADTEAGGGRILCRGTAVGGSAAGSMLITTTGDHWLTFEADAAGCQWGRAASPAYTPGTDTVYATGNGAGTRCNIRFKGIEFVGAGPVVQAGTNSGSASNVTVRTWQEGGKHHSAHYLGAQQWSVRYRDDEGAAVSFDGHPTDFAAAKRYATGVDRYGCAVGFAGYTLVYDCDVHEFLGTVMQLVGSELQSTYASIRLRHQRYATGVVQGYVHQNVGGYTVSSPATDVMRITGPVGGHNFGADAAGMLGSAFWGVSVSGMPGMSPGATATYPLVGSGTIGGAHYVDVARTTPFTTGAATAGAVIVTAKLSNGEPYYIAIHPDGLQIFGSRTRDCVLDWVIVNCPSMQSYFTSGENQSMLWMENVRDDGSNLVLNFADSSLVDTIIRRCTFGGTLNAHHVLSTEVLSFSGTEIRNCVFGAYNANAANMVGLGAIVDCCHFITGAGFGTNVSTGAWFAGTPTIAPYSMEPLTARKGTGSSLLTDPEEWSWVPGAARSTRGCLQNVGTDDWSTDDGVVVELAPAVIEFATVNPTTVLGSVVADLGASELVLQTVDPTVTAGSVTVVLQAAVLEFEAIAPSVVLGSVSVALQAAVLELQTVGPTVTKSSVVIPLGVAELSLGTVAPIVSVGLPSTPPPPPLEWFSKLMLRRVLARFWGGP